MRKKGLVVLGFSVALSLASVFSSYAGEWKQDAKGWWYQNDDGGCTKNDWQQINGNWYHFDEAGYMQTGWHLFPRTYNYTSNDGQTVTYTEDDYYYLTESGELLTDKSWEGGCILPEGVLVIDEVSVEGGKLSYWRNTLSAIYATSVPGVAGMSEYGHYESSLGWKSQMLLDWNNRLSDYKVYGSFSMDYQLPANWAEECPAPLMTAAIDYICLNKWGGVGIVNWSDEWQVDENNVIHIKADYWEYKG